MSYSDKNKIFFGLLHYIFTEQSNVNWAFKTSLINYTGINENVSQRKYKNDSISNDIIKYVKDIKPYHVQFDHYIEKFNAKDDTANVRLSDSLFPTIDLRLDAVSSTPDIEDYLYTEGTINTYQKSSGYEWGKFKNINFSLTQYYDEERESWEWGYAGVIKFNKNYNLPLIIKHTYGIPEKIKSKYINLYTKNNISYTKYLKEYPKSFGEFINIKQSTAKDEARQTYVYIISLHFENGYLPIIVKQNSEIINDQNYFEEINDNRINSATWIPSWNKWINTIAYDSPDLMQWDTDEGANADNMDYPTAMSWNWDRGRLVDGHPSVTTERFHFEENDDYLRILDTYDNNNEIMRFYYDIEEGVPQEFNGFPEEFGEFVNIKQTLAINERRNSYCYILSINFENGHLPIIIYRDGTIKIDQNYFEEITDNRLNSATWISGRDMWINTIATDTPDLMEWNTTRSTNADNLPYPTAMSWNWDRGRLVNGHPSVTTERFHFEENDDYLSITDTYNDNIEILKFNFKEETIWDDSNIHNLEPEWNVNWKNISNNIYNSVIFDKDDNKWILSNGVDTESGINWIINDEIIKSITFDEASNYDHPKWDYGNNISINTNSFYGEISDDKLTLNIYNNNVLFKTYSITDFTKEIYYTEYTTSFDDSKLNLGTKFYNYEENAIYKLVEENNKRKWVFDSYPLENSLYYFKKEDAIKIYDTRYNPYAEQDIIDMYDLSYEQLRYFENTTMANRLFLFKTHDLNLIKDYLNAHFKGIIIDSEDFNIDRFGYDAFLYDKKPYEFPVRTNIYYLSELPSYVKPISVGTNVIKLDYPTQVSKNMLEIWKLYNNGSTYDPIKDFSIDENNIITIFDNIVENEKIRVDIYYNRPSSENVKEYFKAYAFSESSDENLKKSFYDVNNVKNYTTLGDFYELSIPTSSFEINNLIVNIENPNGYRFTANLYKIENNNIIIPKIIYKYINDVNTINDLPKENLTMGDVYKVNNENRYYIWNDLNWEILNNYFTQLIKQNQTELSLDINWKIYISIADQSLLYDKIYTWEDVYGISNNKPNWNSYYKNMGLVQEIDGGEFLDPYYSENRPSELTVSYPQDTLTIYVSKANAIPDDYEGKIDFSAKQIYNFDYKNLHERFNTVKSAKLLNDFNLGDTEISFNKDIFEDPYVENDIKYPGKILIDSELIEYFEKEINDDNIVTLKKLRRGTNGSFIHDENHPILKNTYGYAYKNPKSFENNLFTSYYFVKNINMKKFTINGNIPLTNLINVYKTNNITLLSNIDNNSTSFIISNNTIQLPTYDEENNLIKKGYMFIDNDKIFFKNITQNEDGTYTISDFDNPYNKKYDYGTQIPSKEFIKLSENDYTIYSEKYEDNKILNYISLNTNPKVGECIIIENRNKNVFD